MSNEKILGAEGTGNHNTRVISGNGEGEQIVKTEKLTTAHRVLLSTEAGGLQQLPAEYDLPDGDWQLIDSDNPFEVLYLDYQLYKLIKPNIVAANYTILEKFWKDKIMLVNTGGNRVAFKNKYGEGTVEGSLVKLKRAYEKINTPEAIEQYYYEINAVRINKGEAALMDSIEHMMMDGCADKAEIDLCIRRGLKYELTAEEAAAIIKKHLDAGYFKPYGNLSGGAVIDQLLSVESWMTQDKIEEAKRLKDEREKLKIQILPGKFASTINEIGSILFDDPVEAKEIIKDNLLKPAIAQKDIVLARTIGKLSEHNNIDFAFLTIVYKLNPSLPFAFAPQKMAKTVQELCRFAFENEQTMKLCKEHFKKGHIEIWLSESDTEAYRKSLKIRDNAENLDLALLEFLYTFEPLLPYRFAGSILVKTPAELCAAIDKNKETWAAGIKELYDSSIIVWLTLMQQQAIVTEWNKAKASFKSQSDVGLEYFLHLLNKHLAHPNISASQLSIRFPKIQSGQKITTDIAFTNETRGCAGAYLSFTKVFPGIALSSEAVLMNNTAEMSQSVISLEIDSSLLLKGINYETSLQVLTSEQQEINIPISFRIIFPKNAFWMEVAKYSLLIAALFVFTRLLLATDYSDWLINSHSYYISWNTAASSPGNYALFGWSFFLFLIFLAGFVYFKIKTRVKK